MGDLTIPCREDIFIEAISSSFFLFCWEANTVQVDSYTAFANPIFSSSGKYWKCFTVGKPNVTAIFQTVLIRKPRALIIKDLLRISSWWWVRKQYHVIPHKFMSSIRPHPNAFAPLIHIKNDFPYLLLHLYVHTIAAFTFSSSIRALVSLLKPL